MSRTPRFSAATGCALALLVLAGISVSCRKIGTGAQVSNPPADSMRVVHPVPRMLWQHSMARGETQADPEGLQVVRAPAGTSMEVSFVIADGAVVRPGDLLLQLDPAGLAKLIGQQQAALHAAEVKAQDLAATVHSARAGRQMKIAEAGSKLSALRLKERKIPVIGKIPAAVLASQVRDAQAQLQSLEDLDRLQSQKEDLQLKLARQQQAYQASLLHEQQSQLHTLAIRATIPGVVQLTPEPWGNGNPKTIAGDMLDPGEEVLRVTDPHRLEITADIPEADLALLRNPQVRLTAVPDSGDASIPLRLLSVGTAGTHWSASSVESYTVWFAFAAPQRSPAIAANMSLRIEIAAPTAPGLVLPRPALHCDARAPQTGDGACFVLCRTPDGSFAPRRVAVAGYSDDAVVVSSGLTPRDAVEVAEKGSHP